jgi:23S rRNA (uracil1939-C5)-methyltransferase
VDEVAGGLPERIPLLWDLFAGVGLFGAVLRERCRRIVAVESDPQAIPLLRRNLGRGASVFTGTESEFLRRRDPPAAVCIVDPPRPGLTRQSRDLLARSGTPRIVYVGCDAASFAADVGGLVSAGYGLRSVTLLDLYPQTAHVEAVAHLTR